MQPYAVMSRRTPTVHPPAVAPPRDDRIERGCCGGGRHGRTRTAASSSTSRRIGHAGRRLAEPVGALLLIQSVKLVQALSSRNGSCCCSLPAKAGLAEVIHARGRWSHRLRQRGAADQELSQRRRTAAGNKPDKGEADSRHRPAVQSSPAIPKRVPANYPPVAAVLPAAIGSSDGRRGGCAMVAPASLCIGSIVELHGLLVSSDASWLRLLANSRRVVRGSGPTQYRPTAIR